MSSPSNKSKALIGLQCIYGPTAQPRSEGQAAALELVHNPPKTCIIVLPTSSGKSVLFFSVAAMTVQQTVIVVVPFAALVDDIVDRAEKGGLKCEEWLDETSGHELQQLIVVSADRAVSGGFLHYAKGLELQGQLAVVFFDECHVAYTDTSYRARLRELWTLRYLNCPFICLTATLIVDLEWTLRERLCIEQAQLFRRSTARPTIQYRVQDSQDEPPSEVGMKLIPRLVLPARKRGVIYVRSYKTGEVVSEALQCPFYRAKAEEKGEVLQEWIQGPGGWIVATGALGTGINIEGIVYVVHIDRPYGLTSFVQQSGRGGRNGEVSQSTVVTRVQHSRGWKRREIMSEYSIEQVDEDAMTAFIQSAQCRREVLARYLDGDIKGTDCKSTDSVLCDRCIIEIRKAAFEEVIQEGSAIDKTDETNESKEEDGQQAIAQTMYDMEEQDEKMLRIMNRLQGGCIYCKLMFLGGEEEQAYSSTHTHLNCIDAKEVGCSVNSYKKWREGVDFGQSKHCWECGLSQRICRRLEEHREGLCEYPNVMLVGIFILHQQGFLEAIAKSVGFQGEYSKDIWEWMNETAEGWGTVVESNWMRTWQAVCKARMEAETKE
jgi:superfamily II DNA helicase RecQ